VFPSLMVLNCCKVQNLTRITALLYQVQIKLQQIIIASNYLKLDSNTMPCDHAFLQFRDELYIFDVIYIVSTSIQVKFSTCFQLITCLINNDCSIGFSTL
jgi:hypothetical protein